MPRVLLVENDFSTRRMITLFLSHKGYEVIEAENGEEALDIVEKKGFPDVVITDVEMPVMGGIALIKKLREREVPSIIFTMTAFSDPETMKEAAFAGADEFISKPIDFKLVAIRLDMALKAREFHIEKAQAEHFLKLENTYSSEAITELKDRNRNLASDLLKKIYRLSEHRDDETHEHTLRVGLISEKIGKLFGLGKEETYLLKLAAPLHDLGKIGIPDAILLKPGKLTNIEFNVMKTHSIIGYEILKDSTTDVLKMAASIALTHHERWDGSGYPNAFRGNEIPIGGLIVAIADSFDAIVSKRPYKKAMSLESGFEEIRINAGKLYSPSVVNAFLEAKEGILEFYSDV
ncbi:HD domain-containing phosphohydrolase [Kosmotoga pacifica]|uniref:HD domain-containing phosphohydrolase n=1 Tax=Kosmotoga pacifica TaxID=1330330 RepID=UPI00069B2F7A|nr:HD domain-containing phosphohydrolase [Kosmotoga pacifica]